MSLTDFAQAAKAASRQLSFGYALLVLALAAALSIFPAQLAAEATPSLTKQSFLTPA